MPYALTEEFVAIYRMHPLMPHDFDFRSARDDAPTLGPRSFSELTGPQAVPIMRDQRLTDIIYTFATMNPGLVTLHNFPRGLQTFRRPDNGASWIWRRSTSCAVVSSGCRGTASSAACCTCPYRRLSRR